MIVKPAITWLNRAKDPDLAVGTNTILKSMAENRVIYNSPSPSLAEVQAALDNFVRGTALAADGGRTATSAKYAYRKALTDLVRQLAGYVALACQNDLPNLMLSGFPHHKPMRQPIGQLSAPQRLVVKHGIMTGALVARVKPVFGAVSYNWRITANQSGAGPVLEQDSAAKHTFSGLTSGQSYKIEVSVLGTAGTSGWSSPISMFAD